MCADFGIYILANDRVLEYFKVLINSIRFYNKSIPIVVIPYDDQVTKISTLFDEYTSLFANVSLLERCDQMGRVFLPDETHAWRMFRKLVSFHGPFSRFLYVDADIALLQDPVALDQFYKASGFDLLGFDVNHEQVYKAGAFRNERIQNFRSQAITAGVYLSSKHVVSIDLAEDHLSEAMKVHHEFVLGVYDQGYFNFLLENLRVKFCPVFEVDQTMPLQVWSDSGLVELGASGGWYRRAPSSIDDGKRLPLIHWAGYGQFDLAPNRQVFRYFAANSNHRFSILIYEIYDRLRDFLVKTRHLTYSIWRWGRRKLISLKVNYLKLSP